MNRLAEFAGQTRTLERPLKAAKRERDPRRGEAQALCSPAKMCYPGYMRTRKTSSASQTMTLRLDPDTLRRLDDLAQATDRSKAWLAAQAVKTYLDLNEWQIAAIHQAVVKADRRNTKFFTQEEVDAWLTTWGTPQEREPGE